MSSNRTYFPLIIAASFFYLIIILSLQLFENSRSIQYIPADEFSYLNAARMIYENFTVHPTRPFFFSLLIGLPFLTGVDQIDHYYFVFSINVAAWVSVIFVIYNILRRITSNSYALAGSLLFILNVGNIAITNQILTESIYTLLLTLISMFFFKAIICKKKFYYFLSFLGMSISILIKPGLLFLFIIFFLILFFNFLKKFRISNLVKMEALLVYLSITLVVFQCVLINKEYGNFTVSYIDRLAWYQYIGCQVSADKAGVDLKQLMQERIKSFENKSWDQINRICLEDLKLQMSEIPSEILNAYLTNLIENSYGNSYGILKAQNINNSDVHPYAKKVMLYLSSIQNILYSALAVILFFVFLIKIFFLRQKNRMNIYLLINLITCVFIIASSGVSFWQGDRFHIVFVPLCIISLVSFYYSTTKSKTNQSGKFVQNEKLFFWG